MFQAFFEKSDMLVWPLVGLLVFLAIFCSVLAYVFLGLRDKTKIDEVAALPLAEDTGAERRSEEEPRR